MSGPTPGPWTIGENELNWRSHVCGDSDGRVIAECMGYAAEQCEANARLIAAAPEMLEALEEALELLTYHYDGDGRYHSLDRPNGRTDTDCEFCRLAVQAETILARAKGEDNG